jgi:4'-phosphopantetheinyl transferase EntD
MHNMQAYDLTPEEAYRSGYLFHGPIYQGIQEVTAIFDEGIVGKIAVAPKDQLFRSTANPILLVDPVFLDVIGQLFGLWAIPQKKYIFPLYIEKIEIYEPTPPVGSVLPVWVKVTDMKFHTVSADMEIQDEEGNVWMRVKCWQDWIFRWPPHYYGIRRRPKKYLLSSPLPIAAMDENVAIFALEDIEKLPGADIEFLARAYLTMEEYARYRQFAGKPRAIEWLMGRLVAKDAVRAFHARNGADEYLHPASFALEADDSGKPYVVGIEGETIHVSLAHKDRYAIAVASTFPVGIDLEKMEPRQKGFAQMILNEEEKPFLQDLSEKLGEDVALTLLFSAKEAASKAIGTGLRPSPKAFQIVRLAEQMLWVQAQDRVIPVQYYFDENWIITIAMMDTEQVHV